MNRLSYSQLRLYSECGQKYKYYYKDKIRETTRSGALIFGSAFDVAIEATLKNPSVNEKEVFDNVFTHSEINKEKIYVPDSCSVVYSASDFDGDILLEEDFRFLKAKAEELSLGEDVLEVYSSCAKAKKQRAFKRFTEEQNKFLNLCNWVSLRRKGHLMLDEHRRSVLPRIKKVIATQQPIKLDNGEGDVLIGYADLHCIWEDGREVILDYKTSSIEYEEDSVVTSPQLSIYSYGTGVKTTGFIVFRKGIIKNKKKLCSLCGYDGSGKAHKTCNNEHEGKRCGGEWNITLDPKVETQVILDDIPPRTEEIVLNNLEQINRAIKAEVFVRNLNACKSGYGPCPYIGLCFRNSDKGLVKV